MFTDMFGKELRVGDVVLQTAYGDLPQSLVRSKWTVLDFGRKLVKLQSQEWSRPGDPYIRSAPGSYVRRVCAWDGRVVDVLRQPDGTLLCDQCRATVARGEILSAVQ